MNDTTNEPNAQTSGDDAAVEALKNLEVERGNSDDDGTHLEPMDLADWQINGIITAIRAGKVPGVFSAEHAEINVQAMRNMKESQIAALRARLAEAEAAYDVQHKAHAVAAADRDRLAAQVAELDGYIRQAYKQEFEEDNASPVRDLLRHMFVTLAERSNDSRKALSDLAAERERAERAIAEKNRLSNQYDEMRKAGSIAYLRKLNEEASAARAEADALRGEVERLKGAMSDLHRWADAYPISVFKEPDFAKAAKVLSENGMTLDALSAATMRMMTGDLRKRIRAAGVEVVG